MAAADRWDLQAPDTLRVLTRRRYFNGWDREHDRPAGSTLREIVDEEEIEGEEYRVVASIDGVEVQERYWPFVKPKAGTSVSVVRVPRGELIALVGIAIASFVTQYGAYVALAVSIIASVVAGVLTKAPSVNFRGEEPTESNQNPAITGSRNRTRLNGPIRTIFGKMLVFPDFGGKPFSETVGSDQYARLLLDVGYGPLRVSEIKLGETPVENFGLVEGTDYIVHQGFDDDGPLTLFTQDVTENRDFSIALNIGGDTGTIVAEENATEGSLDIVLPSGLFDLNDRGDFLSATVEYSIEYRVAGSMDAWQYLDIRSDGPGVTTIPPGQATTWNLEIRGNIRGYVVRGVSWTYPGTDQYEVRVTRRGSTAGGNGSDDSVWNVLRSIEPLDTSNTRIPNLCQIEMRIKTTDQLNGVVDTINCVAESIYPDYTLGGGFKTQTRTAADFAAGDLIVSRRYDLALAEMLRRSSNERPVPDSLIDLQSLDDWRQMTDAKGFSFDAVLDSYRNLRDLLSDICGSGRARFTSIDGRFGVVVNEKKDLLVTTFTERNSWGLNVEKNFPDEIHGIKVTFVDSAAGYQPNEVVAYADGYDEANADRFEFVDLWGVAEASRAVGEGRFILAETQLRPRRVTFNVPMEGLTVTSGDLVRGNWTVMGVGLASGRITGNISTLLGQLISFEVDEALPYTPFDAYACRVRFRDGTVIVGNVISQSPGSKLVRFEPVIDITQTGPPVEGDLILFGLAGKESGEFIVDTIRHNDDLSSRITCVDHSPALFEDIDSQPIPPFDPGITDPTPPQNLKPATPLIESVISDESAILVTSQGVLIPGIEVSWRYTDDPDERLKAAGFRVRVRVSGVNGQIEGQWAALNADPTARSVVLRDVIEGVKYDIEICAFTDDGRCSPPATVQGHEVIGSTTPPPPVQALRRVGSASIDWDYPDPPPDLAGFRIRASEVSANWDSAETVIGGLVTETFFDGTALVTRDTTLYVMVRAQDQGGRLSTVESIQFTIRPSDVGAIVSQESEAPTWPGTKANCSVQGTELHVDADPADTFWRADTEAFWRDDADPYWPTQSFLPWAYYDGAWLRPSVAADNGTLTIEPSWTQIVSHRLLYRVRPFGSAEDPPWVDFPGTLIADRDFEYQIGIAGAAADAQGQLADLLFTIRKPVISEVIERLYVNQTFSQTGVEVPLTKTFYKITSVLMTLTEIDGNDRPSVWGVSDKGAPNDGVNPITRGPYAHSQREQGNSANGYYDIQVLGWGE